MPPTKSNLRCKFLKFFGQSEEAARAFDAAAIERSDEFAMLNFPADWGRSA